MLMAMVMSIDVAVRLEGIRVLLLRGNGSLDFWADRRDRDRRTNKTLHNGDAYRHGHNWRGGGLAGGLGSNDVGSPN
jgi:hypothetical protein